MRTFASAEGRVEIMDVFEAIKGRRSIRAFKRRDVSDEDVAKSH